MKVFIEIDGQELDITEDMIDDRALSLPAEFEDVPCPCPGGPCGYRHRRFTGRASLDLHLDLNRPARWS